MCGFLGVVNHRQSIDNSWHMKAISSIHHRGPDSFGSWISEKKNIFFYHQRLKIIDLSNNANQPMVSNNLDYIIIFNGEIYNYQQLKIELKKSGFKFETNSDTEVILASYQKWGEKCIKYFIGMFSFAIYNKKNNKIFIARDTVGEKPIYIYHNSDVFIFGSELSVILSYPNIKKKIDAYGLDNLLSLGYLPNDTSIIKHVQKLKAANFLMYDIKNKTYKIKEYWSPKNYSDEFFNSYSSQELEETLNNMIEEAVKKQLVADVPIGVLLSGGLDSSLITAFASKYKNNINTYTVKFSSTKDFDESNYAKKIAKYFGTNHHELEASQITTNLFDKILGKLDEPIGDSSLVPTYLICELVSRNCKVVLGGDGGDELFAGYHHYSRYLKFRDIYIPKYLKYIIANYAEKYLPLGYNNSNIRTWLMALNNNYKTELPYTLPFFDDFNKKKLIKYREMKYLPTKNLYREIQTNNNDIIQSATRNDFHNYLSNDILVKTDRASMLNSLELRAPFLDKNLVDFAFSSIPSRLKANKYDKKIILKKIGKKIIT